LANFLTSPDHLGDDIGGLPLSAARSSRFRARARHFLVERGLVERQREGCGDVHRDLLPSGSSTSTPASDSSATSTPILPSPGAAALWM